MKNNKFLIKTSDFIVKYRCLVFLLFMIIIIICGINLNRVDVNYDITSYLPNETETKKGLKLMEKEFGKLNEVQLLITNIKYEETLNIVEIINQIDHIKSISFNGTENYYKDNNALVVIQLDEVTTDERNSIKEEIIKIVKDKEYYLYIENDFFKSKGEILIFSLIIIVIVLVFLITTHSYFDIILAAIIFGISMLLNMGSNFLLGQISYITKEITIILQLVLSVNYLIIFLNHYNKEIDDSKNKIFAIKKTVFKSIPEVFVSSLTIFSGFIVLFFMQLGIGNDIGIVMFKGIICTILTVILLLPFLLIIFNKAILKLRHRNFVPNVTKLSKLIISSRKIILPLFFILIIMSIFLIPKYDYVYNAFSSKSSNISKEQIALNKIKNTFGFNNRLVIVVKNTDKDYIKEFMIAQKLLQDKKIISVNNVGNTKVDEKLYLGSSINYQEFAQIFNLDLQTSSELYQLYANSNDELIKLNDMNNYRISIINWINFLYDKQVELSLNDEIKIKINNYYEKINNQVSLLESEDYSRFIIEFNGDKESEDTFKMLDIIKDDVSKSYDEVTLVGESVSARDFKLIFSNDNFKNFFVTILFVVIILIFTFKSIGITLLTVLTIEGCMLMNFGLITLTHNKIYFISYIIVNTIQIGVTFDYAVIISKRYQKLRIKLNKKNSLIGTLKDSMSRIIISSLIIIITCFLIGYMSDFEVIAQIGMHLAIGIFISMICIIFILPAILYTFDCFIKLTTLKKK